MHSEQAVIILLQDNSGYLHNNMFVKKHGGYNDFTNF